MYAYIKQVEIFDRGTLGIYCNMQCGIILLLEIYKLQHTLCVENLQKVALEATRTGLLYFHSDKNCSLFFGAVTEILMLLRMKSLS